MRPEKAGTIFTICLVLAGIIGSATISPLGAKPALASTNAPVFTLIVSRNGFNGTASTVDLTVHQGDWVQITFVYGDSDLSYNNPHVIAIEGYSLQTAVISKSNPSSTIQFVADRTGIFRIYCNLLCNGMSNLQSGALVVLPTRGNRIPTTLNLTLTNETSDFLLTATVKEANGTALTGVPVKFYENTSFGELWLNSALTSAKGAAYHHYTPERSGLIEIVADYPGNATHANSTNEVSFTVSLPANGSPSTGAGFYGITFPFNLAMIGVPTTVNLAIILIVAAVVSSIWLNYTYILHEILSIPKRRERLTPPTQTTPEPDSSEAALKRGLILTSSESELTGRILTLILLSPLIGLADVILVNSIKLSLTLGIPAIVGLAILETMAVVMTLDRILMKRGAEVILPLVGGESKK